MRHLAVIAILALLIVTGCGYRVSGGSSLPPDTRRVYIELIANETHEPYLENRVTTSLVDHFSRSSRFELVEDRSVADTVLSGSVTAYRSFAVSYDRNDEIADYRSEITVSVVFKSWEGKTLWRGDETLSEEYPASPDRIRQEDNEDAAISIISRRLAENILFRVTGGF